MKIYQFILLGVILGFSSTSCKSVYQNSMFQKVDSSSISKSIHKLNEEYLIRPGDEINLKLYSRKGANLIEAIRTNVTNVQENTTNSTTPFIVSYSGMISLPIIGSLKVEGMTESQLKSTLEAKFATDYIDPFVYLKVDNRRVFLFKGNTGQVVTINRAPTSIFEVIAKSGGMDRFMSSSEIMIIRGNIQNPQVFNVNLKTFQGIQNSETILQANDIIYIPERNRKLYYTMQDLSSIISVPLAIASSILTTVLLVTVTK